MGKLFIMIGVPGVGKSTFIKEVILKNVKENETIKVVSRDEIRFSMVREDEEYFSHEDEVFEKFVEEIKSSLEEDTYTVADATHISLGSRTKLFRALGYNLKGIPVYGFVIIDDLKTILEHNRNRTGRTFVPEDQIKKMFKAFKRPIVDEGFGIIYTIKDRKIARVEMR